MPVRLSEPRVRGPSKWSIGSVEAQRESTATSNIPGGSVEDRSGESLSLTEQKDKSEKNSPREWVNCEGLTAARLHSVSFYVTNFIKRHNRAPSMYLCSLCSVVCSFWPQNSEQENSFCYHIGKCVLFKHTKLFQNKSLSDQVSL